MSLRRACPSPFSRVSKQILLRSQKAVCPNRAERAVVGINGVRPAFPAEAVKEPTAYKLLDRELSQQLDMLQFQFPGRYKKHDLPVPVQAHLKYGADLTLILS